MEVGSRAPIENGDFRAIDLDQHRVKTSAGDVPYDKLLIALGAVSNFFGMDDIAKHGFTFKSMADIFRASKTIEGDVPDSLYATEPYGRAKQQP